MNRLTLAAANFALAGLGMGPCAALAQGCSGFPGTDEALVRVATAAASYTYAGSLGAALTVGRVAYGTISYQRTRDPELDATSRERTVELGLDLKWFGRVYLCPLFAFSDAEGPENIALTGTNYEFASQAYGIGVAIPVQIAPRWALAPFAEYRSIRLTATQSNPAISFTRRTQDVYLLWSGGLGLTFDRRLSLRVGISVPVGFVPIAESPQDIPSAFGREEREMSWNVAVAWSFFR